MLKLSIYATVFALFLILLILYVAIRWLNNTFIFNLKTINKYFKVNR